MLNNGGSVVGVSGKNSCTTCTNGCVCSINCTNILLLFIGVHEAHLLYQPFMIGTGLTPEGINQNYINFEIMIEMAWRKSPPNIDKWLQSYLKRRYRFLNAPIISMFCHL